MGSKKYPGENDYDKYLNSNAGSPGAFTTQHKTVFYHSINNDAFEKSVDM